MKITCCECKKNVSLHKKCIGMRKFFLLCIILTMCLSCDNERKLTDKFHQIKRVGNSDPTLALRMLDSMSITVRTETEHIQKAYDLLDVRLHDKAYIPAMSDFKIRMVVDYYNRKGDNTEKQEAFYYAGSVYRDLHDMPRALENFLRSADECKRGLPFDTLMLRNTYSNLHALYYKVQNYHQALQMAQAEEHIARKIGALDASTLLHAGASLIRLKRHPEATEKFSKAFGLIKDSKCIPYHEDLYSLLYHFSVMRLHALSTDCYRFIEQQSGGQPQTSDDYLALGEYFMISNLSDSAIVYFQKALNDSCSLQGRYDASKMLYTIYHGQRDYKKADYYANAFVKMTEKLDLGGRQQLAATVNNEFQYHRDKIQEAEIFRKNESYLQLIFGIIIFSVLVICSLITMLFYRRGKRLQAIIKKNRMLEESRIKIEELKKEVEDSEMNRQALNEKLRCTQEEAAMLAAKILQSEEELQQNRHQLSEKINQNKELIMLMHQSEFGVRAKDVIQSVRLSSEGRHHLSPEEWISFQQAVDEIFPTFKDLLVHNLDRVNKDEMHVCYLMRIGLANPQIINLTGLPRTTIWRWTKKFDWILTSL